MESGEINYRQNSFGKQLLEESNRIKNLMQLDACKAEHLIINNYFHDLHKEIQRMPKGDVSKKTTLFFCLQLYKACSDICIINNDTLLEKLHSDGLLTEAETKWIIPSTLIDDTLNEIQQNKNFIIIVFPILQLIRIYLSAKLFVSIVERFRTNYTQSSEYSEYALLVQNFKSRRRKKVRLSEFDTQFAELCVTVDPILKDMFSKNRYSLISLLENANSRNLDNILLQVYFDFCYLSTACTVKKNEKLRLLYPLFALVMKDRNWSVERFKFGEKKGKTDFRAIDQRMRKFIYKQ